MYHHFSGLRTRFEFLHYGITRARRRFQNVCWVSNGVPPDHLFLGGLQVVPLPGNHTKGLLLNESMVFFGCANEFAQVLIANIFSAGVRRRPKIQIIRTRFFIIGVALKDIRDVSLEVIPLTNVSRVKELRRVTGTLQFLGGVGSKIFTRLLVTDISGVLKICSLNCLWLLFLGVCSAILTIIFSEKINLNYQKIVVNFL